MHNISYSKQAEKDLEDAIEHIAKTSTKNAMAYLLRYEDKIELLRLNPQMGTECIIRIYHSSVDYANKFNRGLI